MIVQRASAALVPSGQHQTPPLRQPLADEHDRLANRRSPLEPIDERRLAHRDRWRYDHVAGPLHAATRGEFRWRRCYAGR